MSADTTMHPDGNPLKNIFKKKQKQKALGLHQCPLGFAGMWRRRSLLSCQSSHHARFDVLTDALGMVMVVMVVVGSAGRRVEGRDAVEVEHEVLPVAHRRVALVARDAHCGGERGRRGHVCARLQALVSLFVYSCVYSVRRLYEIVSHDTSQVG